MRTRSSCVHTYEVSIRYVDVHVGIKRYVRVKKVKTNVGL